MTERTFVMVKPDGVGRRLVGGIVSRYERKGLRLIALKMQMVSEAQAAKHYAEHEGKDFFADLLDFIRSGPTIQMVWEGERAVEVVRKINGATDGVKAEVGTIRGDYALTVRNNLVHASDSTETAQREIALWFSKDELIEYSMPDQQWLASE